MATQFVEPGAAALVCANAGTAMKENIITTNNNIKTFRIFVSP
jgi:hypothetical protein